MTNRDYWRKRAEQDQLKLLKPFDDLVEKQKIAYEEVLLSIQREIDIFVKRFGNNNGILDYYEATKLLNSNELKEFRMTLEEYTRLAKDKELSKKFKKELENASLKVRITRLQALQLEIMNKLENLYSDIETELTESLKTLIYENQNRIAYNMSIQYENLITFSKFDDSLIDKLIKTGWGVDEENFSSRLWKNKTKLINTLNNELKTAIIRGQANSQSTFKALQKCLGATYKAVKRIVLTESAYFSEKAKEETYKDFGVEKYEVVGTLDTKTCNVCGSHDGEVWEFSKYEVGVTAPIYHPNCRCTTAPYFDEDEDYLGERFARDKNGKAIKVSENMKYEDWKKKYVDNLEDDTENNKEDKDIYVIGKIQNNLYKDRYKNMLTDDIIITNKQIEHIKERRQGFYEEYNKHFLDIINTPDIVFEDNKNKNTLLVCREINKKDKKVCIVLRLVLSDDNPKYKNSIITAHIVDDKKIRRWLKSKEIIYKK